MDTTSLSKSEWKQKDFDFKLDLDLENIVDTSSTSNLKCFFELGFQVQNRKSSLLHENVNSSSTLN